MHLYRRKYQFYKMTNVAAMVATICQSNNLAELSIGHRKTMYSDPIDAASNSTDMMQHLPPIDNGEAALFVRQKPPWHRSAKSDSIHKIPIPYRTKNVVHARRWTCTPAKIDSMQNRHRIPAGGHVFIKHQKCRWTATAKVNSHENWRRKPTSGTRVKIFDERLNWRAEAKVVSHDATNVKPMPKRDVNIVNKLPRWEQKSKVGSLDKVKYMRDVLAGRVLTYGVQPRTEEETIQS